MERIRTKQVFPKEGTSISEWKGAPVNIDSIATICTPFTVAIVKGFHLTVDCQLRYSDASSWFLLPLVLIRSSSSIATPL